MMKGFTRYGLTGGQKKVYKPNDLYCTHPTCELTCIVCHQLIPSMLVTRDEEVNFPVGQYPYQVAGCFAPGLALNLLIMSDKGIILAHAQAVTENNEVTANMWQTGIEVADRERPHLLRDHEKVRCRRTEPKGPWSSIGFTRFISSIKMADDIMDIEGHFVQAIMTGVGMPEAH